MQYEVEVSYVQDAAVSSIAPYLIHIKNSDRVQIIYKIGTKSPGLYIIKPGKGLVEPKMTAVVSILAKPPVDISEKEANAADGDRHRSVSEAALPTTDIFRVELRGLAETFVHNYEEKQFDKLWRIAKTYSSHLVPCRIQHVSRQEYTQVIGERCAQSIEALEDQKQTVMKRLAGLRAQRTNLLENNAVFEREIEGMEEQVVSLVGSVVVPQWVCILCFLMAFMAGYMR